MMQKYSYSDQLTFFQKLRSIDYYLLISILLIGIISCFAMYSTDGGQLLYHTKSHIMRFVIFFIMMIFISFINIKYWHATGYIFYIIILGLLFWASFYGITASGSTRWINLYFLNLQPSELMKIAIIICFAKYYHRLQISNVNKIVNIIFPIVLLLIPIFLVLSQPDLGTSILIAASGIIVLWLAGTRIKYFVYASLIFIISAPFIISFQTLSKLRILSFFDPDRDPLGAGYQIIQSQNCYWIWWIYRKRFFKRYTSIFRILPEKILILFSLYTQKNLALLALLFY